jgi:chromosome transmission fidelity protein 4
MLWTDSVNKQDLHMACANGTLVNIAGRDKLVPKDGLDRKISSGSLDEEMDFETQPPPIVPSKGRKRIAKSNVEKDEIDEEREEGENLETQPAFVPESGRNRIAKTIVNNDESDDDVDFKAETTAPKAPSKKSSSFVADEAEEGIDDEDDDESNSARGKGNLNDAADTREDNDEDLLGDDYDEYVESRPLPQVESLPEPQPPFAPAATPLDLPRRIMCWNHIGTVSYLRADDGITRNTVDIDFTDAATRRPMTFTDNMNFILGSIGEEGAIFASDVTDDDDREDDDDDVEQLVDGLAMSEKTKALVRRSHNKRMHKNDGNRSTGSNVYFHRFETFGPMRDKDWLLTLPDGERATGCACGEGWAAVITRYVYLPLFLLL